MEVMIIKGWYIIKKQLNREQILWEFCSNNCSWSLCDDTFARYNVAETVCLIFRKTECDAKLSSLWFPGSLSAFKS